MVYSIIQKSKLEGAKRLDAEYYQPEFLDMEIKIKKFKNYLLKDLINNFVTGRNLKQIDPYFISIFLNSKFGYLYWERVSKGTARALVSSENINAIRIPCPDKKINDICKSSIFKSSELMRASENLHNQAETLLLAKLKIKNLDLDDKLSYVVNLSDAERVKRKDAEYFQPKYGNLIKHIKKNCNGVLLGDLVSIKKGIEPGADAYLGSGKPASAEAMAGKQFIRVSSMSKYGINGNDQKYLSEDLYNELKEKYEPKKGEILLTKDASLGITYVVKENIKGIISGGILRLQLKNKDVEDEYLALCLNSIVGQMHAERDAGGSIIKHWKSEQIKNVIIPILPKQIQQKISSLIRESFEKRIKAKELLEEAKRKVEEMIEGKQKR